MTLIYNRRGEAWVNRHADMVIDIIAEYKECVFSHECFRKEKLPQPALFVGKRNPDMRCLCIVRSDGNSRFFEFRNNRRYWIKI